MLIQFISNKRILLITSGLVLANDDYKLNENDSTSMTKQFTTFFLRKY